MKKILLIATGGTIASKPTKEGLAPLISSEEILQFIPEVKDFCDVKTLQLMNLDSTNINSSHWTLMAQAVRDYYDAYDGFVISHGTDTMGYTAAALSYMIQNSQKPVVITGSQKSLASESSDARQNLLNAFAYAADDKANGVHLVFDGKVIIGTRARKMRTKSFNAFSSIDYPEVAIIRDGKVIHYITETVEQEKPDFSFDLSDRVFVLKLIPGMSADIFAWLKEHYDALIIESFGVGGIPCYGDESFLSAIEDWILAGKTIVMTTQVPHEGSDMEVYQVGLRVKEKYEVLEAYNMPLEAVVTKMMWILAQTGEPAKIRELFYTPIQKDILDR